jgi:enoyl-CoA hydratase
MRQDSRMVLERALSNGVLILTMNRPERRNALDRDLFRAIGDAFVGAETDPEVRAIVLTGAGDEAFCAGMDLKAFVSGQRPWVGDRGFAGIVQRSSRKPLIAAVEGFAVAGGFEIALACDLIVAAAGAKFGIPEVKRSLVAAGGALLRLPQRMPYGMAMELALTGDTITTERAAELGVVNRVAEAGGALDAALDLAAAISKNAPLALIASKEVLRKQRDWDEGEFWHKQGEITGPVFGSEDAQEGAKAFAEKRDPVWKGR